MDKLQQYDSTAVGIIKGAAILDEKDLGVIERFKDELKDVFLNAQVFRTRTEMEVSVLKDIKYPTADSKYWQCVREQNVMFQNLVLLSYEYRKGKVETQQLKAELKKTKDPFKKELLQIDIERKEFVSKTQEREAKDRIREIGEWHDIKQQLIPKMRYSPTDVNEHQFEAYRIRFAEEAKIAVTGGSFAEKRNAFGLFDTIERVAQEKLITTSEHELLQNK